MEKTTFQIGLTSSFLFLLLPVQLFAIQTLERLGYKRQMILGWLLRAVFLAVPMGLVWAALVSDRIGFVGCSELSESAVGSSSNGPLLAMLAASYFVFSAAVAISNSTHFIYLPELSSEEQRPTAIAVYTAVQGLVAGMAPIGWGPALKQGGAELGINLPVFLVYLSVGLGLCVALVVLYRRLPETRFRCAPDSDSA